MRSPNRQVECGATYFESVCIEVHTNQASGQPAPQRQPSRRSRCDAALLEKSQDAEQEGAATTAGIHDAQRGDLLWRETLDPGPQGVLHNKVDQVCRREVAPLTALPGLGRCELCLVEGSQASRIHPVAALKCATELRQQRGRETPFPG